MAQTGFAPGKIILSGEHAVVYGYPGIAMPTKIGITATYEEADHDLVIHADGDLAHPAWKAYLKKILTMIAEEKKGTLTIANQIPAGKGMGSSTALVAAVVRALIGDHEMLARNIEDTVSPKNSGIDFAVIWNSRPIRFEKGKCTNISLPRKLLENAMLIDTGTPNETTKELVAWVQERKDTVTHAFEEIAACTKLLEDGTDLLQFLPRHHRAQVMLGVVPKGIQRIILSIESIGGAAKVLGAGARTGGGGMVLAVHPKRDLLEQFIINEYPLLHV